MFWFLIFCDKWKLTFILMSMLSTIVSVTWISSEVLPNPHHFNLISQFEEVTELQELNGDRGKQFYLLSQTITHSTCCEQLCYQNEELSSTCSISLHFYLMFSLRFIRALNGIKHMSITQKSGNWDLKFEVKKIKIIEYVIPQYLRLNGNQI